MWMELAVVMSHVEDKHPSQQPCCSGFMTFLFLLLHNLQRSIFNFVLNSKPKRSRTRNQWVFFLLCLLFQIYSFSSLRPPMVQIALLQLNLQLMAKPQCPKMETLNLVSSVLEVPRIVIQEFGTTSKIKPLFGLQIETAQLITHLVF